MKRVAIYAGTFDPITKGHVDIIARAAALFDEVIVGVATSDRKKPFFSDEKRVNFCRESIKTFSNVRAELLENLTVDFAQAYDAHYLIRGVRTSNDINDELSLASMNALLSNNKIETIFLPARDDYRFISATMVREIIALKGDVSLFVPECVVRDTSMSDSE